MARTPLRRTHLAAACKPGLLPLASVGLIVSLPVIAVNVRPASRGVQRVAQAAAAAARSVGSLVITALVARGQPPGQPPALIGELRGYTRSTHRRQARVNGAIADTGAQVDRLGHWNALRLEEATRQGVNRCRTFLLVIEDSSWPPRMLRSVSRDQSMEKEKDCKGRDQAVDRAGRVWS